MLSFFINWNVDPELVKLGGISIRYYGLLFALAFIFGYKVEEKMFKSEGLSQAWLDKLWIYVAIATVVGARLGHCIFYDWAYYSEHPLEMIFPFQFNPFKFTGYQGLASHGAAIGIIAGLWYYSKKVSKKSIFWILDRAVIPIALAGFFIRMGNLMNSEIIGSPTTVPWGFHFMHVDDTAWIRSAFSPEQIDAYLQSGVISRSREGLHMLRHPAQLYEAVCYLISFGVLMYLYWRTNVKKKLGFLFGMFLILIFTARFCIEFVKEVQEPWEADMTLNMGQWLSIPFVALGIFMLYYSRKHPDISPAPIGNSQENKVKKNGKKKR